MCLLERIFVNYVNVISDFAIPMVIGIFAFAFPLLFQTASRIDDKYNSTLLIKAFRKDWISKWFIYTLLGALACCGLWVLQLPRLIDCGEVINILIDNSALILLILSTISLAVMTIYSMWLMYVYYMPDKLLERLIKQYHKAKASHEKELYFELISKILFYSIKKEGEPLARELQTFYFNEFINYREGKSGAIVEYPHYYYNVIFDANECLCQRERKNISLYNSSFYGLFIDEYQKTIISDKTYSFLWKCLIQSLFYKKREFVVSYWHVAHQYCNLFLDRIRPQYDENMSVVNQDEIEKWEKVRNRFVEFHYALGGYLMKTEEFSLITQLTSWTNQTPPKYVLVPETMYDVIERFMDVDKGWTHDSICYYEQRYPFPDVSGVNAEEIIKMWIKRYLAILFLRQYTLQEHFIYSRTLEMPNPPQMLAEKKRWNEQLILLKRFVNEYLGNLYILKALGLESLGTTKWFEDNNKKEPNILIDEFINRIADNIETTKTNQEIDNGKKKQFEDVTKRILNRCFEKYFSLKNEIKDDEPHESLFYYGIYQPEDKMAFASDQDISYLNSDTIVSEMISANFRQNMPNIFQIHFNRTSYSLKESDLFKAIDILKLDCNSYTILSIGLYLQYYGQFVENNLVLSEDYIIYKSIPIIELGNTGNKELNNSLIIVKNEDIPCILHKNIEEDIINKYKLTEIDGSTHIYTNVIDLNKNDDIRDEIARKTNIQDLSQIVLVCVDLKTEVRCRKGAKCIQLKVFSQFDDQGTPNNVEDVVNIWNKEK